MTPARMLDGYAGEGGAALGYALAGFAPYGVESDPARAALYPFPVHVGDVLVVFAALIAGEAVPFTHPLSGAVEWLTLADFVLVHTSPPCQGYSRGTVALPDRLDRYDRLIAITRALLVEMRLPYVIENVEDAGAELVAPLLLCGRMFGLGATDSDGTPLVLDRHRLFECSAFLMAPPHTPHRGRPGVQVAGVYGGARRDKIEAREVRKGGYVPASLDVLRALIGAPWMSETGLFLSIPPAYSHWLGLGMRDRLAVTA